MVGEKSPLLQVGCVKRGSGLSRNTEVTYTCSRVFLPASSRSRFSSGNGFSTVPNHLPAEVAGTAAMPRWAAA